MEGRGYVVVSQEQGFRFWGLIIRNIPFLGLYWGEPFVASGSEDYSILGSTLPPPPLLGNYQSLSNCYYSQ